MNSGCGKSQIENLLNYRKIVTITILVLFCLRTIDFNHGFCKVKLLMLDKNELILKALLR